ncbi:hypothetical protein GCM10025857_02630 [Alicyclobacillus contaminans]|nr:hypothetical protein GCM10025857_02630 [Alicyclobacillus contaminans]
MFGEGISREGSMIDIATDIDVIQKSGAWYSYNDERLGQGRENAKQFLKEHPEVADEIEQKIREAFQLGTANLVSAAPVDDEVFDFDE